MIETQVPIALAYEPWRAETGEAMKSIEFGPCHSIVWFQNAVEKGAIQHVGCYIDGDRVGSLLWRFDDGDLGSELVVMVAVQTAPGVNRIDAFYPLIEQVARDRGAVAARFHSDRRGLVAAMAPYGYRFSEYVMRKVLQ